ncbi:Metal-dependent hydrolase YbeY, involved in rRNA and/or ribosome maturation and assembly [hydrothermal vent metagenome]|uniref:Metal-dependent hydrolase YbeY, involved in rRNA and/or ribosome maturation and assembly n=1 Tax=hydrothermal vent metagenome TaxID=652676 RepID=A0A3B0ZYV5_9ZZZZ
MNNTSAEPPSKYSCAVDVQCMYADVSVPADKIFSEWVSAVISFLIDYKQLEQTDYEVAIRVVDKVDSQQLNNQYRLKNTPTNVLSFPFDTPEIFKQCQQLNILGDIVVCARIVEAEAQQQNKKIEQHWAHMIVHGVLHLLNYDHTNDDDARLMEALEIRILSQLGYPNPYTEQP